MSEPSPSTPAPASCAAHPEVPARFFCEGCGRLLCDDCLVEGSRLLLCPTCGERALPRAADGPASTRARRAERLAAARRPRCPYSYVFRGSGTILFAACAAALGGAAALIAVTPPLLRILYVLPVFVGGAFGARYLEEVVLRSAQGAEELPDWPDLHDAMEGAGTLFALAGTGLAAALPGVALWVFGPEDALGAAALLGVAAWVPWLPCLGAIACYGGAGAAFRLDLHLRAIAAGGRDGFETVAAGALIGLAGAGLSLTALLALGPLLGSLAAGPACCYAAFTIAHRVGLFFGRHRAALDRIYLS